VVERCSNPVGFVVLLAEPSVRTGIRVDIYDGANPATLLAVLPDTFGRRWNDPLRGPGSGGFKVFANNPILAANPGLLKNGNIARFSLDEVDRFAITIGPRNRSEVDPKGDAGRIIEVTGRGVLAKLEDAQTYLTGGLTGDVERPFNQNAGQAIRSLVAEAQTRGALVGVTTDFTDTDDSHNAPFLVPLDYSERAGTDLLRVATKHGSAYVDVNMTPALVLQYFNTLGVDRSVQLVNAGPIILQAGDNIEELSRSEDGTIRNALLIETPGGFLERIEGASITEHRRREGFLSLGNVASSDAVDRASDAVFAASSQPAAQITLKITDTEGKRPYVDWNKGDWILAPDEDGDLTPYRVRGLTVSETQKGEPQFTPELATITEELEDRLERWLSSMSKGTLGGTSADVAEPVKAAVEVVEAIDSGIGDHLALAPHHDELSDLSDVDLTGLTDADLLTFDQAALDWVPVPGTKDDGDVPTVQGDGSVAWEAPPGGSGGLAWGSPDIDDPLTALAGLDTGSGTWSINTWLQCVVATSTQCRARTKTGVAILGLSVVEVEMEIPTNFSTTNEHLQVGLMDAASALTTNTGTVVLGLRGDGVVYFEESGLTAHVGPAFANPVAGTFVKVRLVSAGRRHTAYFDDVMVAQFAERGDNDLIAAEFRPMLKAFATTAMTARFRNLKAWTMSALP
jgi:uncharacterized protein YbjQ (UPF0145 family)